MKAKLYTFLLFFLFCLHTHAQLTRSLNAMRTGDEIIKQQVEYKNPGKAGINQFWDFNKLVPVNNEYSLIYSEPVTIGDSLCVIGIDTLFVDEPGDIFIGTEHYTMYYYQFRNDSLLLLGHKNPNTELTYSKPLLHLKYPMNYGNVILSDYDSHGSYSGLVDIQAKGTIRIEADALGKMLLPDADTLTVLRIKSTRLIMQPVYREDSTEAYSTRIMETHQWYSKGYRYPVFETVRTITPGDSINNFTTAFYYPPQDHFYLDTDPENAAVLDSLWQVKNLYETGSKGRGTHIIHKVYPNPVETNLCIELLLPEDAPVTISVYDIQGKLITTSTIQAPAGYHKEIIDCTNWNTGTYLLYLLIGKETITQKIIKK